MAGGIYAVLAVIALGLLSRFPSVALADDEITVWFDDATNQSWLIVGLNLVALSSIAFLWFVAVIRQSAASPSPNTTKDAARLTDRRCRVPDRKRHRDRCQSAGDAQVTVSMFSSRDEPTDTNSTWSPEHGSTNTYRSALPPR